MNDSDAAGENGQWRTSVDEVVRLFHDALEALLPVMERARIGWRESEAYDDWDAIAETLYQQMVVGNIEWGVQPGHSELVMPKYDLVYEDFASFSYVAVAREGGYSPDTLAFVGFTDRGSPGFNFVGVRRLDQLGHPRMAISQLPLDDVTFYLRWRTADRSWRDVQNLNVAL